MRKFAFLLGLMMVWGASPAKAQDDTYSGAPRSFTGAQSYKDVGTGIVFYVESDGRHVSAIDRTGVLLWTANPFEDGKLEPYRTEHPRIVHIGAPLPWMIKGRSGNFVAINFDSTQFGILDASDGRFYFLGQD